MNFEENITRLEELSEKIRNPEIGIEDALSTFEEGIKLAKTLEKELEKIEGKIQILMNSPLDEIEEKPKKTKASKNETIEANEDNQEMDILEENKEKQTQEYDESYLELDLFEQMSAPTEGLRQNG